MDFFSGFGRKVSKTAKIVGERTRGSVEANRINGETRAAKAEIEKLYRAYGEVCYRERDADAPSAERTALEEQITGKFEQLDRLKAQLDALRDIARCAECGAENPKGTRFCGHCGARLPEPEPEPKPEPAPEPEKAPKKPRLAFCTECGEPRKDGIRFCVACGSDFEAMEARAGAAEPEPEAEVATDQADVGEAPQAEPEEPTEFGEAPQAEPEEPTEFGEASEAEPEEPAEFGKAPMPEADAEEEIAPPQPDGAGEEAEEAPMPEAATGAEEP